VLKEHEHMRSELGDHCKLCGDPMPKDCKYCGGHDCPECDAMPKDYQEEQCERRSYRDFYGVLHDCNCPKCNKENQPVVKDYQDVERIVKEFVRDVPRSYVITTVEEDPYGSEYVDVADIEKKLRTTLTTYGNARVEKIIKIINKQRVYRDECDNPMIDKEDLIQAINK
jgi:hypothetical protein